MSLNSNPDVSKQEDSLKNRHPPEIEKILCPHCRRTATNGIKCKGICVADSDY
ncbi:conserved hypothetical protein [Acaryochloris marina MBIC11017]|uniref:Uncharacterized protein n=1 Tax=Acaryochloris marina (strain MBIC 11017) TaxID=329726 RepID=B0CF20_ACAM1|nr:conserved hypothetical protein [Acaryochloris marina MBIC11017]